MESRDVYSADSHVNVYNNNNLIIVVLYLFILIIIIMQQSTQVTVLLWQITFVVDLNPDQWWKEHDV